MPFIVVQERGAGHVHASYLSRACRVVAARIGTWGSPGPVTVTISVATDPQMGERSKARLLRAVPELLIWMMSLV